ncbi:ferredoxin [Streptomyces sparsogenes]
MRDAQPEVFDQDDEGLVVVLGDELADDLREEVLRAIDPCPSRSLRVLG